MNINEPLSSVLWDARLVGVKQFGTSVCPRCLSQESFYGAVLHVCIYLWSFLFFFLFFFFFTFSGGLKLLRHSTNRVVTRVSKEERCS